MAEEASHPRVHHKKDPEGSANLLLNALTEGAFMRAFRKSLKEHSVELGLHQIITVAARPIHG